MVPSDPAFPHLHGRPPHGWVNDPNGLCRVDGIYHVFFQHNPAGPWHGDIHWGHASSADLVHWQHEPIALTPQPGGLDAAGCWTGSVTIDDGVPTAVYSGVTDTSGRSAVLLARADRGLKAWTQQGIPAATMPEDDATITAVRDPFIVTVGKRRYAVQGAGSADGPARILVHDADDLEHWRDLGTLLSTDHPVAAKIASADIWECPNLLRIDGRWVLVVSLWQGGELTGVRWLTGELTLGPEGPRFDPVDGGELDTGPCFYAPQVLADHQADRVLLWAWAKELREPAGDWAGSLTFARELFFAGDRFASRPVPELEDLRRAELSDVHQIRSRAFAAELGPGAGVASLTLLASGQQTLVHEFTVPNDAVSTPQVLVDGSMVEVFDGSGLAFTTRAYPEADSSWSLRWSGETVRIWDLHL